MKINRDKFFEGYRKHFGTLSQEKVDDLNFLLGKLDASEKISGSSWDIVAAKYSYVLATVYHETAHTFKPISEMGSKSYLESKKYFPYYGRGYVQLTWKYNYKKFGDFLGIDLVGNPLLANEPENAWLILEEGMTKSDCPQSEDPNFTGFTLENFFNENKIDFIGARKIINGTNKAELIAGYAEEFLKIIEIVE